MSNTPQASPETPEKSQNTRRRGVIRLVLSLVLMAVCPLFFLSSFIQNGISGASKADFAPEVVVEDQSSVFEDVNGQSLGTAMESIGFRQPIKLVILSTDNVPTGNLNEAVLNYARSNHKEWLNAGRDKWADGLVILAVSPSYRKVGTYFGEDVKVSSSKQSKIQEAAKDDFRSGEWSQGMLQAAQAAAKYVPDSSGNGGGDSDFPPLYSFAMLIAGAANLLRGFRLRSSTKRNLREARAHWDVVQADRYRAEQAFAAIGDAGKYKTGLDMRYKRYQSDFVEAGKEWDEIGNPTFLQTLSAALNNASADLRQRTESMDASDDTFAAAAEFFNLGAGWVDVWMKEIGPVMEDLEVLCELVTSVTEEMGTPDAIRGRDEILQWASQQMALIDSLKEQLAKGGITPIAALEKLDEIAEGTRRWAKGIILASLKADPSSNSDKRYEQWENSQKEREAADAADYTGYYHLNGVLHNYDPAKTIRLNSQSAGIDLAALKAAAFGTYAGWNSSTDNWYLYQPLSTDRSYYQSAHSWTPSSDSSSSDYGSSGGGFSGSGSSSSF
ncbi:DUF5129 domain-containing protein [uncultured Actinomyces sp.]|uniref:DUF5129 domain-containing protein n=1 Tax=uncultured Actinomyces sp. TaxID=249061 RepID=UPI0028ED1637|nr:DUF5129 domain-containing protein [uncultured Actinomyces sp.]